MPYGTIKVDNITFTNGGSDTTITVSGLAASTTGDLTVTGTISGAIVRATTISGVTVTGTTVQGASGTFTSITGGVATITSGVFALGSAAAPSISFSGDPNNGIYSPGADQVAISTNGTGRLFVTSAGLVGIGETTPVAKLHARTDNAGSGSTPLLIQNRSVSANTAVGISFAPNTSDTADRSAIIYGVNSSGGSGNGTDLTFHTNANGSAPTEKVRITSAGLVGIGTSSPSYTFDCRGNVVAGNGTIVTALSFSTRSEIGALSNHDLGFLANGTTKMLLDTSGRLGIGSNATAPDTTLYVRNVSAFDTQIKAVQTDSAGGVCAIRAQSSSALIDLMAGGSTYAANYMGADEAGLITQATGDSMRFNVGGSYCRWTFGSSEAARITSAGLVGVGTSAPNARLHIIQDSTFSTESSAGIAISDGTSDVGLLMGTDATNNIAYIQSLDPGTSYATRNLCLNPNGSLVGIGTISPGSALDVVGDIRFTGSASTNGSNFIYSYAGGAAGAVRSGFYLDGTNAFLAFYTSQAERMRITSAGVVGVGTSAPSNTAGYTQQLEVAGRLPCISINQNDSNFVTRKYSFGVDTAGAFGIWDNNASAYRVYINTSGQVGVGTSNPSHTLTVGGNIGSSGRGNTFGFALPDWRIYNSSSGNAFVIDNYTTEALRIDNNNRLLVGTSTARLYTSLGYARFQVEGTAFADSSIGLTNNQATVDGSYLVFNKTRGTTVGSVTSVQSGDLLGSIWFQGADGTSQIRGATIEAVVDATPGTSDMPSRLVFSTTADGASSPTERMRITSDGSISTKTAPTSLSAAGTTIFGTSSVAPNAVNITRSAGYVLAINRTTDDGTLVEFYQDTTLEGSISVSGTTVSYNGAHLSRWSQLPSGDERIEILRGTVLSNIDEMCAWPDEDNEQLNRMKVSDVEGDKNVSGVFQAWDDDDDTYTNDFYCAMTGDFIIRIAAGVTVERGDLLMSAGDGTAKPQDDDIIRSKTIAKVTSTNVSCIYDDGSYCVPCVLMAC